MTTDNETPTGPVAEVIFVTSSRTQRIELALTRPISAREAVMLAVERGLDLSGFDINPEDAPLGVYAERVADDYVVQDGDRVEVYRPLQQDPMDLRRKRAQQSRLRR
jgi:uncharacterized protein